MWASPLTLSFDLREPISAEDLAIMTNSELIAINQDRMGQAAEFVSEDSNEMQATLLNVRLLDAIGMSAWLTRSRTLYSVSGSSADADMMCVGINGTGKSSSDLVLRPAGMTKTEYRTQFSMWCMWASPV